MTKRLILAVLAVLFLMPVAPAQAVHKGTLCLDHTKGSTTIRTCAMVNVHDWHGYRQGMARSRVTNGPISGARIYVYSVRLNRKVEPDGTWEVVRRQDFFSWFNLADGWSGFVTPWDDTCRSFKRSWRAAITYKLRFPNGATTSDVVLRSDAITETGC